MKSEKFFPFQRVEDVGGTVALNVQKSFHLGISTYDFQKLARWKSGKIIPRVFAQWVVYYVVPNQQIFFVTEKLPDQMLYGVAFIFGVFLIKTQARTSVNSCSQALLRVNWEFFYCPMQRTGSQNKDHKLSPNGLQNETKSTVWLRHQTLWLGFSRSDRYEWYKLQKRMRV